MVAVLEIIDQGDGVPLNCIVDEVEKMRSKAGRSVPESLDATVRQTLDANIADLDSFSGEDIFCIPEGKGKGIWGLRRKLR